MTLLSPIWLLLAVPLFVGAFWWRSGSRLALLLRLMAILSVLLALSGLATEQERRAGIVIAVADRSHSMPKDKEVRQKEWIDQLYRSMGPLEKLGVVSFGRRAVREHAPQRSRFVGFERNVGVDGSSLQQALQMALALIPDGQPGRIVLMSDGRWTGRDPVSQAAQAAARGIPIDYVAIQRSAARDIAVGRIEAPDGVAPGEAFMLSAWVHVPAAQRVRFVLKRGKLPLVVGSRKLKAGMNRLLFRDQADKQGVLSYELTVGSVPKAGQASVDPTPENNKARFLIGVKGPRPILHVTSSGRSALAGLLKSGKLDVVSKHPRRFSWSLQELAKYSAVLLENIPSESIGRNGMQNLASWVKETGAGLMLTGGERSYGTGGYIRSPLEPILPVSMKIKQEHRKLFLSLAIVLDRSCSMGVRVDGVNSKMDLANIASVQALKLLGPQDELAVLAVDTYPHEIVPLSRISDKETLSRRIRSIRASGGGIYVYEGLSAAFRVLKSASSHTRHIILFSDTNDSEQPGRYVELLKKCKANNITVSVIGLGGPRDRDSRLLRDIAKRGGGRIFFTRNAKELPRLFAQDTMMVTKSSFVRKKTMLQWMPGRTRITQIPFGTPPATAGFNLTYPRRGATVAMATVTKKRSPFVAAWQAGLGRVLAYTGEVDGAYAGSLARWERVGDFLSSLVRWTSGHQQRLPKAMMLTQRIHRGKGLIELQLDPETHHSLLTKKPIVQMLKGDMGRKPSLSRMQMRWVAPHRLIAQIPLRGRETVLPTVRLPGMDPISLAPMILPYSPEFRPPSAIVANGAKTAVRKRRTDLAMLASTSQGMLRVNMAGVWKDIPSLKVTAPIGHWLLLLAVLLLLLEILERRAGDLLDLLRERLKGLLPRRKTAASPVANNTSIATEATPTPSLTLPQKAQRRSKTAPKMRSAASANNAAKDAPTPTAATAKSKPTQKATPTPQEPTPRPKPADTIPKNTTPKEPTPSGGGMFGALQQASKHAKRRTDRKK